MKKVSSNQMVYFIPLQGVSELGAYLCVCVGERKTTVEDDRELPEINEEILKTLSLEVLLPRKFKEVNFV